MSYFRNFPLTTYQFGNKSDPALFHNITAYIDIIDRLNDNIQVYSEYTIQNGERPDVLSQRLYNTPDYYWMFYLLNEKIRIQGWPLTQKELYSKVKEYYPNKVLISSALMHGKFYIGDTIAVEPFNDPTFKAKILEKNYDLGHITVKPIREVRSITITDGGAGYTEDPTVTFEGGDGSGAKATATVVNGIITNIRIDEGGDDYTTAPTVVISNPKSSDGTLASATCTVSSNSLGSNTTVYSSTVSKNPNDWTGGVSSPDTTSLSIHTTVDQHEATHHWESGNDYIDLNRNAGGGVDNVAPGYTEITNQKNLFNINEDLSRIRIVSPAVARQINIEFQKLLSRA